MTFLFSLQDTPRRLDQSEGWLTGMADLCAQVEPGEDTDHGSRRLRFRGQAENIYPGCSFIQRKTSVPLSSTALYFLEKIKQTCRTYFECKKVSSEFFFLFLPSLGTVITVREKPVSRLQEENMFQCFQFRNTLQVRG